MQASARIKCMQYTIRNVPTEIDEALREQAAAERKSLNQVLIDVVARGLGLAQKPKNLRDLSDIVDGPPLEPEVIQALEDQRRIDPELWE